MFDFLRLFTWYLVAIDKSTSGEIIDGHTCTRGAQPLHAESCAPYRLGYGAAWAIHQVFGNSALAFEVTLDDF